jgi:hypothetical protein
MKRFPRSALALSAALLLGACATTPGYGDGAYGGDRYGSTGGYGYPSGSAYPGGGYGNQYGSQRFIATVQDIDPRGGRMMLAVQDARGYSSQRVEVYFDNNTRLYYRGQLYPVTGLERGDQISVDAVQSGGRVWARQIEVVRNVRETGGYRY